MHMFVEGGGWGGWGGEKVGIETYGLSVANLAFFIQRQDGINTCLVTSLWTHRRVDEDIGDGLGGCGSEIDEYKHGNDGPNPQEEKGKRNEEELHVRFAHSGHVIAMEKHWVSFLHLHREGVR